MLYWFFAYCSNHSIFFVLALCRILFSSLLLELAFFSLSSLRLIHQDMLIDHDNLFTCYTYHGLDPLIDSLDFIFNLMFIIFIIEKVKGLFSHSYLF